jgi:DNA-directed RNA polymerase specialized sigma24 family protein
MSAPEEGQVFRERQLDEEFRAFLNSDRAEEGLSAEEVSEARAKRYLEIQNRLARLFAWRGCHEADDLARVALDRARQKWAERRGSVETSVRDKPNPVGFVCSFVRFVFLEWLAKQDPPEPPPVEQRSAEEEMRLDCLENCMSRILKPGECDLILQYYDGEKRAKITRRKAIAERHNISANAVRLECHRIRRRLRECVVRCVELKRNSGISPI